jgi:hypothetical protein
LELRLFIFLVCAEEQLGNDALEASDLFAVVFTDRPSMDSERIEAPDDGSVESFGNTLLNVATAQPNMPGFLLV